MSKYYCLNIPDIMKQRKGNNKQPFSHQMDAFRALSKTLPIPINGYKGTLLVLPTGGGKTYTSINWICRNILARGIKVLWLAQSSYLIDQAAESFIEEIHHATNRTNINLRVVSSNTSHSNSGSIMETDDVLICTTQTAISAYSSEQLNGKGELTKRPFRRFIDACKERELFIVIDEAHHTPAYGCRSLLLALRNEIKNLYILGLTATPMHMDKRISGWLKEIYSQWICYQADKNILQANKVLSVPKYIEKDTGMEFEVDDSLFDRLANKHKDLPDYIIEKLANDSSRNNSIVSDYINNKITYGKTLIFADRWFQCEYIVEKLKEQGVKAAAVYSVVTSQDKVHIGGSGRRNDEENRKVIQDFKAGKLDVVVNVKMLTEGVDVPNIKTVMITRQTTSNILLTQMIGRALRGEKAGGGLGKDYANIVFFHDTWKRLLPWANIDGDTETGRPVTQGRNPMLLISIQLIKLATADIAYKGFENASFLTFIPVGFYACEYTIAILDDSNEELISFAENIIVYEFNKDKYIELIDYLQKQDLTGYASENLTESILIEKADDLVNKFFDIELDNFDTLLIDNVVRIIRHIAQNNTQPIFIDFHERDLYDMDKLATQLFNTAPLDADVILTNKFKDMGLHWHFFYKFFDNFMDAYYKAQKRALAVQRGEPSLPKIQENNEHADELTPEIKKQVFTRDKFTCVCCGKAQSKGVTLNADHVLPIAMGGQNAVSNLQTLCKHCNTIKSVNEIDYRVNITPLRQAKAELALFDGVGSDSVENVITRIVNTFYHCKALCKLNYHERRNGKFYTTWELVLYSGNNHNWILTHELELLRYVNIELGKRHVSRIICTN